MDEHPLSPKLTLAIEQIRSNFNDKVSITQKDKTLYKFGRYDSLGTSLQTLQREGGDETYATSDTIAYFSSSDAGDTQQIVIEGHILENGQLIFKTQTVTLSGQTKTALTIPLARVTRLYNNASSDFAGDIYIYEDDTVTAGVPQTSSKIHMKVTAGNQSEKASTSISSTDYYIITQFVGYIFSKTAAVVDFQGELRSVGTTNKVFRRVFNAAGSQGTITVDFHPPFIIPKNTDIRVRAKASTTNVDVGASFNGYLASVVV